VVHPQRGDVLPCRACCQIAKLAKIEKFEALFKPKYFSKNAKKCIRQQTPVGIGKIESESGTSAYVRYSEGQLYLPEVWDKEHLERFATFQEMVKKYAEYQKLSVKMMMEICLRDFPLQKTA